MFFLSDQVVFQAAEAPSAADSDKRVKISPETLGMIGSSG
jgi:hypothetical protein